LSKARSSEAPERLLAPGGGDGDDDRDGDRVPWSSRGGGGGGTSADDDKDDDKDDECHPCASSSPTSTISRRAA